MRRRGGAVPGLAGSLPPSFTLANIDARDGRVAIDLSESRARLTPARCGITCGWGRRPDYSIKRPPGEPNLPRCGAKGSVANAIVDINTGRINGARARRSAAPRSISAVAILLPAHPDFAHAAPSAADAIASDRIEREDVDGPPVSCRNRHVTNAAAACEWRSARVGRVTPSAENPDPETSIPWGPG
jgi:hypothetical protein